MKRQQTTELKGVLSILVLLCHCRSYLPFIDNQQLLHPLFVAFGYVSVGIFFFLSGYGLMAQYKKNPNYMKSYFRNRVLPFYVKYLMIVIGYSVLFVLAGLFSGALFFKSLTWGGTIVVNGWYFQAQLFLYIAFGIAFLLGKSDEKRLAFLLLGIILFFFSCKLTGVGNHWYQSVLCFFLGAYYKTIENKIQFQKVSCLAFLMVAVIVFIVKAIGITLLDFVNIFLVTVMATSVFLFVHTSGVLKGKDGIAAWLGNVSFEIYAIHGTFITILRSAFIWINNDFLFLVLVLSASVVCAYILHCVFFFIDKAIKLK